MSSTRPSQLRLLVADDDASCREALGEFFRREGFQVCFASTGLEALARLRVERMDLSVLDVHMPGLTGPEVLQLLMQEVPAPPVPPSILVSSDDSAADLIESLLGPRQFGFVSKPISLAALRRTLHQLLSDSDPQGPRGPLAP